MMLAVLSLARPSAAQSPQAPAPDARVIAVMTDAAQALVFDRQEQSYRVVQEGDVVQGFRVLQVRAHHVVLVDAADVRWVLPAATGVSEGVAGAAAADQRGAAIVAPSAAALSPERARPGQELLDPYAAPEANLGPISSPSTASPNITELEVGEGDPSADSNTPRTSSTAGVERDLIGTFELPIRPSAPPSPSTLATSNASVANTSPSRGAPSREPRLAATSRDRTQRPQVPQESVSIRRTALDAALADLPSLSERIEVNLSTKGIEVLRVAPGSLPHQLGLRAGDLVTAVDGTPITSLNEAASVYARLIDASELRMTVKRGARNTTYHVRIVP